MNAFVDLLKKTKVNEIPPNSQSLIAFVRTSNTVQEALNLLSYNNILSAPVLDDTINRYVGFIDMSAIVAFAVQSFSGEDMKRQGVDQLLQQKLEFTAVPIRNIEGLWRPNQFVPVSENASLYEVVHLFLTRSIARVPVINHADNTLINIITQSRLVELLYTHLDKLADLRSKTVDELVLGWKWVPHCWENTTAIDAFRVMVHDKISGMAVLNFDQQLVGALSVRDLRAIGTLADFWPALYLTTGLYLQYMRSNNLTLNKESVIALKSDSFESIVKQMVTNHIHRVYIVDQQNRPIGHIQHSDVLQCCVNYPLLRSPEAQLETAGMSNE